VPVTVETDCASPGGVDTVPVLELMGVGKRFPGVQALVGVDVVFRPGRIHALLGENGAGKSTLLKIVDGAEQPDSGRMLIDGKPASVAEPRAAMELGISMVHQELSIVPQLTLAENVVLGREPRRLGVIDRRHVRREARRCMTMLGYDGPLDVLAGQTSVATQQLAEIARALSRDQRIVILDEPTASLGQPEVRRLFDILRRLRAEGKTIVYVSHRLSEVIDLRADDVTVLRDGSVSGRFSWKDGYSEDDLVRAMVGRSIEVAPLPARPMGSERLRVAGLVVADGAPEVSFAVRAGEIVGLAGMVGSGRTEIARAIAGAEPPVRGRVLVDGREVRLRRPRDAVRAGIALLTEDRRSQGLALNLSIAQNVTLPGPPTRAGVIRRRQQRELAAVGGPEVGLHRDPATMVRALSGGNQQKVVLARWMLTRSGVFVFDEPTRGVDVGAKQEIYELMRRLAEGGAAIVVISSELVEVLALADRILVIRKGAVVSQYDRERATEELVLRDAARSSDVGQP
jgi:ribose transport system ATP-binding protein